MSAQFLNKTKEKSTHDFDFQFSTNSWPIVFIKKFGYSKNISN